MRSETVSNNNSRTTVKEKLQTQKRTSLGTKQPVLPQPLNSQTLRGNGPNFAPNNPCAFKEITKHAHGGVCTGFNPLYTHPQTNHQRTVKGTYKTRKQPSSPLYSKVSKT